MGTRRFCRSPTTALPGTKQGVEGKGTAGRGGAPLQLHYRLLRLVDELKDVGAGKGFGGVVVSRMALDLHRNEPVPEVANFRGKGPHSRLVVKAVPGRPVFQGTVNQLPTRLAAVGWRSAGEGIGATMGQGMKQGVIGRADGPSQVGLPRPSPITADAARRQMPGNSNQVVGIHTLRTACDRADSNRTF